MTVRSKFLGSGTGLVRVIILLWWFIFWVVKKFFLLLLVMVSCMLFSGTVLEGFMRKIIAGTWMLVGKERW